MLLETKYNFIAVIYLTGQYRHLPLIKMIISCLSLTKIK